MVLACMYVRRSLPTYLTVWALQVRCGTHLAEARWRWYEMFLVTNGDRYPRESNSRHQSL